MAIPGFSKKKPEPQPTVYSREFTQKEILSALSLWLESNGINMPSGEIRLYGLKQDRDDFSKSPTLKMSITSME